jgi:hypothetical protein
MIIVVLTVIALLFILNIVSKSDFKKLASVL